MNNNNDELNGQPEEKDLKDVASFNWVKIFRVLLVKIQLWFLLLIVIGIGAFLGYSKMTEEKPVNLRPAVKNATNVEITISTCNKQIDEQGFDIRAEERSIEKKLRETEGVKKASVLIERDKKNCKE